MSPQSSFGKFRLFFSLFLHLVNPNKSIDSVTTFLTDFFVNFSDARRTAFFFSHFSLRQERGHEKSRIEPLQFSLQLQDFFQLPLRVKSLQSIDYTFTFPTFFRLFSASLRLKDFLIHRYDFFRLRYSKISYKIF